MENSSINNNAPLSKRLIAVFSKYLHHNYKLERHEGYQLMWALKVNMSYRELKGETVTQSAFQPPAEFLLRPHRDEA